MNALNLWRNSGIVALGLGNFSILISKQQGNKMQFSQVGNIEKIKKSKQFSQDEATERTRKGRKDNKRKRGKDRRWMEEPKA